MGLSKIILNQKLGIPIWGQHSYPPSYHVLTRINSPVVYNNYFLYVQLSQATSDQQHQEGRATGECGQVSNCNRCSSSQPLLFKEEHLHSHRWDYSFATNSTELVTNLLWGFCTRQDLEHKQQEVVFQSHLVFRRVTGGREEYMANWQLTCLWAASWAGAAWAGGRSRLPQGFQMFRILQNRIHDKAGLLWKYF